MLVTSYSVFYFFTGKVKESSIAMITLNIINTVVYIIHERSWEKFYKKDK